MKDIAKRIAQVSVEARLPLNEEEYLKKFTPSLMKVVYAWSKGAKFIDVCKLTDVFEGMLSCCVTNYFSGFRYMYFIYILLLFPLLCFCVFFTLPLSTREHYQGNEAFRRDAAADVCGCQDHWQRRDGRKVFPSDCEYQERYCIRCLTVFIINWWTRISYNV